MSQEIDIKELSAMLKALGEPSRLKIFQFLCSCSSNFSIDEEANVRPVNGVTVGDVCCNLTGENTITSTASHHLKELRYAGLITMEKKGKNMLCSINQDNVKKLSNYLSNMINPCCIGSK